MDFYIVLILGDTIAFVIMLSLFWISVVIAKKMGLFDDNEFEIQGGENEFVTTDNEIL